MISSLLRAVRLGLPDFGSASTGVWARMAITAFVAIAVWGHPAMAQIKPDTTTVKVQSIEIHATPLASFDRTDRTKTVFGKLEWRGGLVLTSGNPNFGGWSGLAVSPDGQSFIAVSDAGSWMDGRLAYAGDMPTGVTSAREGPLKARDGSALSRRRDRDAEAIALTSGTPGNGSLLIAFEQNDRIGRFSMSASGIAPPSAYIEMPAEAKSMRVDGFEAVTVLAGGPNKGSMIAFAERASSGGRASPSAVGQNHGWIWQNGKPQPLQLGGMGGFDVTDVASLPDGRLLVLERRFRWLEGIKMRLRVVAADAIKAGAVLQAQTLLTADMTQEIDNMEGLAVSRGAHGETVVTMISDDNFNHFLQRTVLLQFKLND